MSISRLKQFTTKWFHGLHLYFGPPSIPVFRGVNAAETSVNFNHKCLFHIQSIFSKCFCVSLSFCVFVSMGVGMGVGVGVGVGVCFCDFPGDCRCLHLYGYLWFACHCVTLRVPVRAGALACACVSVYVCANACVHVCVCSSVLMFDRVCLNDCICLWVCVHVHVWNIVLKNVKVRKFCSCAHAYICAPFLVLCKTGWSE